MQREAALTLAIVAVERTAGLLRNWREQGRFGAEVVGQTIKAEADRMAHDSLVEVLGESGYVILSEEEPQAFKARRPARYWLIDPLDGTSSFVGGYLGFVTQAAFMENGRPVAAAVCAPALDLLYTAIAAGGAEVNGRRLGSASESDKIRLIDNYPEPRGFAAQVYKGLYCSGYVESGSIGLKICRVADGTADLFVKDVAVRDWDIAAPQLILTEAGGSVLRLDASEFTYTSNPEHHGLMAASTAASRDRFLKWYSAQ